MADPGIERGFLKATISPAPSIGSVRALNLPPKSIFSQRIERARSAREILVYVYIYIYVYMYVDTYKTPVLFRRG